MTQGRASEGPVQAGGESIDPTTAGRWSVRTHRVGDTAAETWTQEEWTDRRQELGGWEDGFRKS